MTKAATETCNYNPDDQQLGELTSQLLYWLLTHPDWRAQEGWIALGRTPQTNISADSAQTTMLEQIDIRHTGLASASLLLVAAGETITQSGAVYQLLHLTILGDRPTIGIVFLEKNSGVPVRIEFTSPGAQTKD